jgi:hypothetical protein
MRRRIGGEIGQQPQGRGLIVDEHAVAAVAADLAADQHLVPLRLQTGLLQHLAPAVPLRLEDTGDRQHLGPGAHHLRAGPHPGQQRQRIHHDGLARPGLAREHVEALSELDGGFGQDGQVADVDLAEHDGTLRLGFSGRSRKDGTSGRRKSIREGFPPPKTTDP